MEAMWNIIMNIPWWVYLVAIYIVRSGLQASKTRIISFKTLFIVPIIFSIVYIYTLVTTVTVNYVSMVIWSMSLLLGIKVGQWLVYRLEIEVDKRHLLIRLPGTWSTLIIMSFIFFTQFYFGYDFALHPEHARQIEFKQGMLAVSTFCIGLLIGRLVGYLYYYKNGEDIDLKSLIALTD